MSLINQMLRDLDERQEQKTAQIHEINLPPPPGRPFPWIPTVAVAVICMIVAAGLAWYFTGNQGQSVPADELATAIPILEKEPVKRPAGVPLRPAEPDAPSQEVSDITLPRIADDKDISVSEVPQTSVPVPTPASESSQPVIRVGAPQTQTSNKGLTAEAPAEEPEQPIVERKPSADAEDTSYLPLIITDEPAQSAPEPREINTATAALKSEHKETEEIDVSVLERVRQYVSEGRLAEAEAVLWRELKIHPDAADVRESLATLLIRGKRYVEATALLQQGRELMPDHPPFVGLQARILLEEGDTGSARSLLEVHLHGREGDQVLLSMLGVVYQQEGDFLKAQAVYARLLEQDRTSAGYWAGLAFALDAANDEVRSLEAFRRALALGGLPVAVYDYARQRVMALSGR